MARTRVTRTRVGRTKRGTGAPATPPDGGGTPTSAPVISSVNADPTGSTTATITWTTDQNATGVVDYDVSTTYTTSSADVGPGTSFSVDLTGLSADTLYYFRIWAVGDTGLVSYHEATFATQASGIPASTYEGFGSVTSGGDAYIGSPYHVTTTSDTGTAGSLRHALAAGNRYIVFDVSGTFTLGSMVTPTGLANITLDGTTAPSPGVTLTASGGQSGSQGVGEIRWRSCHDLIIKGIRFRNYGYLTDGMSFFPTSVGDTDACYNVIIDRCSFSGHGKENLALWGPEHDFTITNCIFGPGWRTVHNYGLLISSTASVSPFWNGPQNVSVHRNLFYGLSWRQPAVGYDDGDGNLSALKAAPGLSADVVNNLVWNIRYDDPSGALDRGYGTVIYWGAKANVVNNYYQDSQHPGVSGSIVLETPGGTLAYIAGNYSKDGGSFPSSNSARFSTSGADVTTLAATTAASNILTQAGCRTGGLDAYDQGIINAINAVGL